MAVRLLSFFHIAGEIAAGNQVFYVNRDVSGGDAKQMVYQMTDVINKTRSKELYKTLRGLSAKGMTIVLLTHANKYTDADGKPNFEGTGDLRTDVDELIPRSNEDGSMTVSTAPDKARGAFEPITFEISPDREVTQADYVDVLTLKKATAQRQQDETIIEAITEAIDAGEYKQTDISAHCKDEYNIGWRTVERVLNENLHQQNIDTSAHQARPCFRWLACLLGLNAA